MVCESMRRSYQILEEIGRGRYGVVSRCLSPISGDFFAVKTIDKLGLADDTDRECLVNEPKIAAFLSPHRHILRVEAVFETEDRLAMVLDLCHASTLHDRIAARRRFGESEARSVMRGLVEAIAHCHGLGIVHRDVKPENVLFDIRDCVLKLSDFGSAEFFGDGRGVTGIVGTPYYVAPEVISGGEYGEKVDVWSAGVILYVMLAGVPPFYGDSAGETFEAVARANLRFPTKIFRSVSPAAKDLIRRMICRDVSKRLSAAQVLRHQWILSGEETC